MNRWLQIIVGAVMILFGVLWTLQGLDVVHGSGMSGHAIWAVIGVIVTVAGAVWLFRSLRSSAAADDL